MMSPNKPVPREQEWMAYYEQFPYFTPDNVLAGCYPRILEYQQPKEKAIVLVHGLSDSPYYMKAIGEYFHDQLDHNVYLPLLHYHGLKRPEGMEEVQLEQWIANVRFAIDTAAKKAKTISVGGLSTGGTLSFYETFKNHKINGNLFLFSVALDVKGILGFITEKLLPRTPNVPFFNRVLVSNNCVNYTHVDPDGARQLGRLIHKTDSMMATLSPDSPFLVKTFAAHSEFDRTANIKAMEALMDKSRHFTPFIIPKALGVPHANVVLKEDIVVPGEPLIAKNPMFDAMMWAIARFEENADVEDSDHSSVLNKEESLV